MNLRQTAGVCQHSFTALSQPLAFTLMLPVIALVYVCVCVCECMCVRVHVCVHFSLRRGTARWFSQWRLSPALGRRVCVCVCVSIYVWLHRSVSVSVVCVCVCIRTVKTTCWWVALYLGFQIYAVSYQLNLSSFLFQITTHAHEQTYLLVCVGVCVCVCVYAAPLGFIVVHHCGPK